MINLVDLLGFDLAVSPNKERALVQIIKRVYYFVDKDMAKWQGHGKKTSFSSEVSLKLRFTYIISDTVISGGCGGGAAYDGGDCSL